MFLSFIGFIILAILGVGFCLFGLFLFVIISAGLQYVGKWYPVLIIIQFFIGIGILWLAFTYAPFSIVLG